ncbi:NAD(P)H-binding protein [Gynuella sp.]|uniref:NAD(P)H-binding protein n=1 Tax=Gynuella sp. TaxID=2969146 RepID=UPI003D0A1128
MTTLVLGASGATGQLVAQQLLAQGEAVIALVRSKARLTTSDTRPEQLKIIETNITQLSAADYLRSCVGQNNPYMNWVVVRPDTLMDDAGATEYEEPSPVRSPIFDSGKISRINVSHFIMRLVKEESAWQHWQGQSPVLYNRCGAS